MVDVEGDCVASLTDTPSKYYDNCTCDTIHTCTTIKDSWCIASSRETLTVENGKAELIGFIFSYW